VRKNLSFLLASAVLFLAADRARADAPAEVQALLDKAIKAHGGEEKLNKHKAFTLKMKGKSHVMGMALDTTGEMAFQRPDQFRMELEFEIMGMKFKILQVFNKGKGWLSLNGMVQELDKDLLAEMKEGVHTARVEWLTPLKDKAFKLSSLGESKVNGRAAVGVKVSHEGQRDVSLYFDKEKGLLLKTESRTKDEQGMEVNQENYYLDYKEGDGVPYASKFLIKRDGKDFFDAELIEYKLLESLDDNVFGKP
jgi:hypothetical protein